MSCPTAPSRRSAEVRAAQDRVGAFLGADSVPLQHEQDMMLPGPHGDVPCRLYFPEGIDNPACLVYAHGGGFMQGSLDSWDHFLRELVRQGDVAVLSVDYHLSPEVKFPVAFDEMVAMTRLAAGKGAEWGIDPTPARDRRRLRRRQSGARRGAGACATPDEKLLSFQL